MNELLTGGATPNYNSEAQFLVVDDDQTLLKFFKIHLNKFFSHVIVVTSVKEATDVLKEKQIELVISDIKMPKTTGIQLIRKVRNHDPSIPVFLVSGAMLTDEQKDEVAVHADGFLKKPFSVEELHSFILRGLACRTAYKQIREVIDNEKFFGDFVKRKKELENIKDEARRSKAIEIYKEYKKVG